MGVRPGPCLVDAMFIYGITLALIPLAADFWAGGSSTFDLANVFQCPSLAWLYRSFRNCGVASSPRHYPNAPRRTTSHIQAFRVMGVTTRGKKSLTRDSDIDASLRLIDGVRNSPTVRTPTVPTPNPASNEDADVAIRRYMQEQAKLTDEIYKARLHRAWAKSIREDVLGDKKHHFRGTDDAGLLSDLVVQLRTEFESAGLELKSFDLDDPLTPVVSRVNGLLYDVLALVVEKHSNAYQEEHAALRYPANVDPQPILAREQRLVRDNKASDWTPTEATRKLSLYTRLDPAFYAAVKRVQQRQQQQQRAQHPKGFRMGQHKAPPVGFDRDDQRAKPFCGRCKKAGKGESYHFYRDCPLGGRQHPPTSAAAFCIPIDEEDAEGVHALAMCALFQQAADDGAESFARAAAAYGPPAVLCAGAVGGIDVSAYGFAVEQQSASDEPVGDDILRRLDDLAAEFHSAANHQVHFTHASFPPPDVVEQQASALVCGPAAAGTTPEEQVPAGGAAASASAVPAPAMPVSQWKDVKPAPLQSARVTTTADADGEFAGFVQTVNHAAIGQVDLTGYDTDDYEDLADGSFIVKPRTPAISANHASESATHVPQSGGASRTYGCGKPPWGFPAHAGPWGFHYFVSLFLLISIMGVGAAAYTAANDIDSVQVSGRAAPQPVLCRGDLCIYPVYPSWTPSLWMQYCTPWVLRRWFTGRLTHWRAVLQATTVGIVVTVHLWTLTPSSFPSGSGSAPLWWCAEMCFDLNMVFNLVYALL
ncbi:hypothetical protein CYMTET_18334 [Cymbomonas tetramitiformis]|uniref:Uncharacterized protein n=1 Tax=Cymbomonas tetramitiformis TaxID=36881 RepID=A0AAE0G891_9CHLO|nr:hypothetical protein CYMTET_18334 [Cymbomonas tetramitiformis]